jgi:hypothetical protein
MNRFTMLRATCLLFLLAISLILPGAAPASCSDQPHEYGWYIQDSSTCEFDYVLGQIVGCTGECIEMKHSRGSYCEDAGHGTGLACTNTSTTVPNYRGTSACNTVIIGGVVTDCNCTGVTYSFSQIGTVSVPTCSCSNCP